MIEINENRSFHEYLIRLDDDLSTKLVHFSEEHDMKYTGVIRRSLRQFFQNEEFSPVKKNDLPDENPDK